MKKSNFLLGPRLNILSENQEDIKIFSTYRTIFAWL